MKIITAHRYLGETTKSWTGFKKGTFNMPGTMLASHQLYEMVI